MNKKPVKRIKHDFCITCVSENATFPIVFLYVCLSLSRHRQGILPNNWTQEYCVAFGTVHDHHNTLRLSCEVYGCEVNPDKKSILGWSHLF